MTLILASGSPRRKEILSTLGVAFTVRTAETDETCDIEEPSARVSAIAARKCEAVRAAMEADGTLTAETMILAADTLVVSDGLFLGKPADEQDAVRMVGALSGKKHSVCSGIAIWYQGKTVTNADETEVEFAPMTQEEIRAYVATGEPFGKAGAYAIQGHASRYITGIRGDYFNVVGLPVYTLVSTVKREFGISL